MTKAKIKAYPAHNEDTILTQASDKIKGFRELYQKMERNMSMLVKVKVHFPIMQDTWLS